MRDTKAISWEIIGPAPPPGRLPPPAELLRQALRVAEALEPFLKAAATGGEPILLLVNDPHRTTQTRAALNALAEYTRDWPREPRWRALVATGTHLFSAPERRAFEATTFADSALRFEKIFWHDVTAASDLIELCGERLNRWLAESRFLLPIGSVEPHYFAGVTGAHKTVTIGCLSRAGIERNHAGALDPASDVMRLRGNPVYDGVASLVRGLERAGKRICAINQVVRGRGLVAAAAGDPLETLDALLPTVRQVYVGTVPRPVDVLHLRVPPPLGRSLYQADKALKNNHRAVRDGGGILFEAECSEGIGPDAFMELLRRASDHATACRIVEEEGYRLGDHKAVKLRYLTDTAQRGVRVALVSPHISAVDAATAGMRALGTVESALEWLAANVEGPLERGVLVDDAGLVSVTPV
jgi:nickel-dependent lactate racemase